MVSAHADAIELGHIRRAIAEDIADDSHGTFGRINISITNHEFFEDVILNGAAQLLGRYSLLLRCDNIERHDREHRAVHGHRYRHLTERNLVEQNLHVEDRVNRHACLAHIPGYALVIGVVSSVRGKIERDRKALLSCGQVPAVKRVGLFGGGEARVLPNGPGSRDIHRAVRSARIGRNSCGILKMFESLEVLARIETLHRDVLGREPCTILLCLALSRSRAFHLGLQFDL